MSIAKKKALRKLYRELKKAGEHVEASKILQLVREGALNEVLNS